MFYDDSAQLPRIFQQPSSPCDGFEVKGRSLRRSHRRQHPAASGHAAGEAAGDSGAAMKYRATYCWITVYSRKFRRLKHTQML